MKNKFASFLITGKAASLPFMMNNAVAQSLEIAAADDTQQANKTIPARDVFFNPKLQLILHEPGVVKVCNGKPTPADLQVAVTGLLPNDIVYIFTADNKDYAPFQSQLGKQFRVGNVNMHIGVFKVQKPLIAKLTLNPPFKALQLKDKSILSVAYPFSLNGVAQQGKKGFYMQALILRNGKYLFSGLDGVTVNNNCYGGGSY